MRKCDATLDARRADPLTLSKDIAAHRPRVLVVVTRLDVGGVPEHILMLIENLSDRYDITVACREVIEPHRARLARAGAKIILLDLARLPNPFRDLRALLRLSRTIRAEKFDIVHSHMSKGALIGGLAARLAGAPAVVNTAHNFGVLALTNPVLRTLFKLYDRTLFALTLDRLVTVSRLQEDRIVAAGLIRRDRVSTVLNGIDPVRLRARAQSGPVRGVLGIGEDTVVVVTVARLVWMKALDVLIEAVASLGPDAAKVRCLIVGGGVLAGELQALIEQRGVADRVQLLGERHDVPGLLALSDIFALPSVSEGMPIAIMEAMAFGLPVLATKVDGNPELVLDGRTGLLVEPRDRAAFAAALGRLIADPQLRHSLGEAGRARVESTFSDRAMAETQDRLYRSLLPAVAS